MKRSEIFNAVETVWSALKKSHASDFLVMMGRLAEREASERGGAHPEVVEALGVFREYSVLASAFGPIESKVAALFALDNLNDVAFWFSFVTGRADAQVHLRWNVIARGMEQLSGLRDLLAPAVIKLPTRRPDDDASAIERFTVTVVEEESHLSRPARLVKVLDGTNSIYEAHARILSLPSDTLVVAACDSGSDKAFDFLGIAKAIKALKETIALLWDRIVFHRQRKMLVNLRLVAESLPVLDEIAMLRDRNSISPEQAELLRRQVIDGATQLVEAGAIIEGVRMMEDRDIRALAAPEPKLLAAPQPTTTTDSTTCAGPSNRKRKTKKAKQAPN